MFSAEMNVVSLFFGASSYAFFIFQITMPTEAVRPFLVLKTVFRQACCLDFCTWGTFSAPWRHPGMPLEQQEGHVGVRNPIFIDFVAILGSHFESCLLTKV